MQPKRENIERMYTRPQTLGEEIANSISHGAALIAAIAGSPVLIIGAARGIEVTVSFEEKSFEGSGVYLLGAVLERFLAEYAAMNHFTQTVVTTVERGEIARWPARSGSRRPL